LGACLRTADAAGIDAVVVPKAHAVRLTAAAVKTSTGAAETVPVFRAPNLARTLDWLKKAGVWVVGADADAPRSLYAAKLAPPMAIVLGGEGRGVRRLTRDTCDELVSIPMQGSVESLNVSVAAGVVLFELLRQAPK
jgi:23S rRNA (guanosine2251-2'-O)-methyltransferase